MSTVTHLSPLAESFLHNFQYTLGLLNRPFIDENSFNRAARNLHASLTTLLLARPEIRIAAHNGRVHLDGAVLPDSYVLQKIFVRNRCPAVIFLKELPLAEFFLCLKEMESLLKQELDPSVMVILPKQDLHYRWLAEETIRSSGV
jgi:hypothetical protein